MIGRRAPCVIWPCRRCDRAGRTSWRVREAWHTQRRRRIEVRTAYTIVVLTVVVWAAAIWSLAR